MTSSPLPEPPPSPETGDGSLDHALQAVDHLLSRGDIPDLPPELERNTHLQTLLARLRAMQYACRSMVQDETAVFPDRESSGGAEGLAAALEDVAAALAEARARAGRDQAEIARRTRETTLLSQISSLIASSTDVTTALNRVCADLARFLQVPQAGFALLNPEQTSAEVIADFHPSQTPSAVGATIPVMGNPSMAYVQVYKTPLAIVDAQNDPLLAPVHDLMRRRAVQSILLVPMLVEGQVIGTLGFDAFQRQVFVESEVKLVQHVANQVGQVLVRKQAEEAEREQRKLADALRSITAALSRTLELDRVLDQVLSSVGDVVPHDTASIALFVSGQPGQVRIVRARGETQVSPGGERPPSLISLADVPIMRRMFETGQPSIVPDTQREPEWVKLAGTGWVRSYAGVPIGSGGHVLGLLNLNSGTPGFFTAAHAARLQAFADQAAIAVRNAQLYDEVRRYGQQMATLYGIGLSITSGLEMDQVRQAIFEQCRQVLPVDAFYIAVYDDQTGLLHHPLFYDGDEPRTIAPRDLRTLPGLTGEVILKRQTVYLPDTLNPQTKASLQIVRTGGRPTRSYVGVPLIVRDRVVGVISMQNFQPNAFNAEQIRLLETVALQAAAAVENARLYAEARQRAHELEVANRQAQEARAAAESANRAKSTFVANMSHELRTPLNAILGFSQLMGRDAALSADQRENLAAINRSGEHLLELINDVLELSKIEAGRIELQESDFDLYAMLRDLEDMFRLRAQARGLSLSFELAPDLPRFCQTDEGKLRQVLINLLSNAVKFTERGGIKVRGQWLAGRLHFEVEDTGVGIAPDELALLFDPFFQTASSRSMQQGTGLGLTISRDCVRLMGGELRVRSQVGRGSTFSFDARATPISALARHEAEHGRVVGLAPGQPEVRLLIVDDDEPGRNLLARMLEPLGLAVREAVNGQEAVAVWRAWQPNLIWMDLHMPVLDGREAARRIRMAGPPQPVIVALTASVFEEERAALLASGFDDIIYKPFREAEILKLLDRSLGIRFVYEGADGQTADRDGSQAAGDESGRARLAYLLRAELPRLPPDWPARMTQAALEGDVDGLTAMIGRVRSTNVELAGRLSRLADDFEHAALLDLIRLAVGEP